MTKELTMEKTRLPAGWVVKTLGEVCEINPKKSEINNLPANHLVSFLPMKDLGVAQNQINPITIKQLSEVKGSYTYFRNNDVLLAKVTPCFENGKLGIAKNLKNEIGFGSSEYIVFRPKNEILSEYLFYTLLSSKFRNRGKELMYGAVGLKRLSKDYVKNFIAPFPLIEKQKQIVATLDKAFAAIATAKANAEQNLQNATALFESYLKNVFDNKGDDWEEKTLGEVVDIKTGKLNSNAMEENGKYPFFTCSRKIFAINEYAFDSKAVLLAGNNASGDFNVKYYEGKFNAYQRTYVITVNSENELLYSYLKHKLLFHLSVFKKQSVGANTKFLKLGMIKGVKIILPPIEQQKQIVQKLDSLSIECEKLEAIYTQKIADLEEIKKSVLQKAFSGQLNTIN